MYCTECQPKNKQGRPGNEAKSNLKPLCRSRFCGVFQFSHTTCSPSNTYLLLEAHTHPLSVLRWPCCCSLNILLCQLLPSFMVSYLSTCSAMLLAGGIVAMNNNKMASIALWGYLRITIYFEFFNGKCQMQYLAMYAGCFFFIFAFLHCNSFSHYLASLAETEEDVRKFHFSDLPTWYFNDALQ